jgi:hypothetical protein
MSGCTPAAPSHRRRRPRRRAVVHHGSGDTWCWAACQQPGGTDVVVLCVIHRRSEDGVGLGPRILRAALVVLGVVRGSEETPGYTPVASAPSSSSSSASVEEVNASTPPSSSRSAGVERAPGCVPAASLPPSSSWSGEYHGRQAAHLQPQAVDNAVVRESGEGARLRGCSLGPSSSPLARVDRVPGCASAARHPHRHRGSRVHS